MSIENNDRYYDTHDETYHGANENTDEDSIVADMMIHIVKTL